MSLSPSGVWHNASFPRTTSIAGYPQEQSSQIPYKNLLSKIAQLENQIAILAHSNDHLQLELNAKEQSIRSEKEALKEAMAIIQNLSDTLAQMQIQHQKSTEANQALWLDICRINATNVALHRDLTTVTEERDSLALIFNGMSQEIQALRTFKQSHEAMHSGQAALLPHPVGVTYGTNVSAASINACRTPGSLDACPASSMT